MMMLSGCSIPKVIVLHDALTADEHVKLGGIYESQGKIELARDQYRAAVRQDKKHGKAWALLGDVSSRLKEYAQAEEAYDEALDLDPKNGDLHNNLAWVYVQQKEKLARAKELVLKAMDLDPGHRPYYLDTLGMVLLRQRKAGEAAAVLREAVAVIPPDQRDMLAEAYRHLEEACAESGDEEGSAAARARLQEMEHDGAHREQEKANYP
jgi:Tfp pilus assembly protein PilF